MNRIIDALTVLILITAAAFIGYTLYAAGDAIRRQLFEVTIPIDLNFERMGADDGNVSGGRELHIPQPPMSISQAQEQNPPEPESSGSVPGPDLSTPRPGTETPQLHPEAMHVFQGY